MRKVPELTIYFWIVKILTTAVGETTSDSLAHGLGPIVAVGLGAAGLAAALWWQFSTRAYNAWAYWTCVVMVAIFGTMAADGVHIQLHIPYIVSTVTFLVLLAVVFAVWRSVEGTLSIHSITNIRREAFYWTTVMTTFALGTAAGDMTATTLHLGYAASGWLFLVLFFVPAGWFVIFRTYSVACFWAAYILTRPLGASFSDWMAVSRARGGLALGTVPVSAVLMILIVGVVWYLSASRIDVGNKHGRLA
jgi:uncharacterized membrane-anchored protein